MLYNPVKVDIPSRFYDKIKASLKEEADGKKKSVYVQMEEEEGIHWY